MASYIQCVMDLGKTLMITGLCEVTFAMFCYGFGTVRARLIWQTIAAWGLLKALAAGGLFVGVFAYDVLDWVIS